MYLYTNSLILKFLPLPSPPPPLPPLSYKCVYIHVSISFFFPLSLPSSDRFRLISRALSTHIYCQTPLDTNQTTILRVAPGSPGHIKDPYRNQPGFVASAIPLKQADQAFNNFEALMNNKNYASLKENTSYALGFISDLNHTILNTVDLLVYLSVWLYPQDRFLDALRVVQV